MKIFEERLDTGLKLENGNSEMNAKIKMDFNKLSPNINSLNAQDISIFMEILKSPYQNLLKHPLSEAFLQLKWNQIKYLHMFLIIFSHIVYSSLYTVWALLMFGSICQIQHPSENKTESTNLEGSIKCTLENKPEEILVAQIAWVFLIIFTFAYFIKEISDIYNSPKLYFNTLDSYINFFIIISFVLLSTNNAFGAQIQVELWQFHVAAWACFFTWLQMMVLIGKLPRFGKYVQMFR